jgi:hypothetical protein
MSRDPEPSLRIRRRPFEVMLMIPMSTYLRETASHTACRAAITAPEPSLRAECPVEAIARQLSALLGALDDLDATSVGTNPKDQADVAHAIAELEDSRYLLQDTAACQTPKSPTGAAFLVMLAVAAAESMIEDDAANKEKLHRSIQRCLYGALRYLDSLGAAAGLGRAREFYAADYCDPHVLLAQALARR